MIYGLIPSALSFSPFYFINIQFFSLITPYFAVTYSSHEADTDGLRQRTTGFAREPYIRYSASRKPRIWSLHHLSATPHVRYAASFRGYQRLLIVENTYPPCNFAVGGDETLSR